MLQIIQSFFERRFGFLLILSFAVGFFIPGLDRLPPEILIPVLASQIFFSCFRIQFSDVRQVSPKAVLRVYLLRFVAVPLAIYLFNEAVFGKFTLGLFLLSVLPAGVSAPAMTALCGGNAAFTLSLSVLTSMLAPFIIPPALKILFAQSVTIDVWHMFRLLCLLIIVPLVLHLPFRRSEKVVAKLSAHLSLIIVPLVMFTAAFAVALRRDLILVNLSQLPLCFIIGGSAYAFFYLFGWLSAPKNSEPLKISYALISAWNNITLGVTLAMLYLPPEVGTFIVITNIASNLMFIVFRAWLTRRTAL